MVHENSVKERKIRANSYVVQRHSTPPILLSFETSCTTSYYCADMTLQ